VYSNKIREYEIHHIGSSHNILLGCFVSLVVPIALFGPLGPFHVAAHRIASAWRICIFRIFLYPFLGHGLMQESKIFMSRGCIKI